MQNSKEVREFAAKKLGQLLGMSPAECGEIVENILHYENKDELKGFLCAFAEKSAEFKVHSFADELFELREGQAAKQARQAKEREEDRKVKVKESQVKKEKSFPKLADVGSNLPTRARGKDDKRLLVIDAASGRYDVLTNCLNCGKVIVEDEGWGPCLFCGNPVEPGGAGKTGGGGRASAPVRGDERGFLESASAEPPEAEQQYNESFSRAVETKQRLLDYDRNAKKRTQVYDDATDWYSESVNPWLSGKQREEALKKGKDEDDRRKEAKRKIHARIDIFGRTVVDASAEVEAEKRNENKANIQKWTEESGQKQRLLSVMEDDAKMGTAGRAQLSGESKKLYDSLRASLHAAGKQKDVGGGDRWMGDGKDSKQKARWESKDENVDEFSTVTPNDFRRGFANGDAGDFLPVEQGPYPDELDMGHCLSMHQPQASLLVHGFKRAEGRTWKSEHRGRLWIHAASKEPDDADIVDYEEQFSNLYQAKGIAMPALPSEAGGYPTSVLLGCIDIEECWTNEEYVAAVAEDPSLLLEDNASPFLFKCLRPRRLIVPVKMSGGNKIWQLPRGQQLQCYQGALKPCRWPLSTGSGIVGVRPSPQPSPSPSPPRAASPEVSPPGSDDGAELHRGSPQPGSSSLASGSLDLWPSDAPAEVLQVLERASADRDIVVLQDGFVHLVGFVPGDVQQRIVDEMRGLSLSEHAFFPEENDGIKLATGVSRMNLGMHWNTASMEWESIRGDQGGGPVAPVPKFVADMYSAAVEKANLDIKKSAGGKQKKRLAPFPEGRKPDIAVVNFYAHPAPDPVSSGAKGKGRGKGNKAVQRGGGDKAPGANMQIHQDNTETAGSISEGYPVMGICLGDACDFTYSNDAPGDQKPKMLRLESGDVVLFGGASRQLWHGIGRVVPRTAPPSLRMIPGRLELSLRVH